MSIAVELGAGERSVAETMATWPRISLVTPVWNSAKYIEDTIQSVLVQNYPNLEYFIVDGGSTDGTLDIIRKYEKQITGWISEPDNGMYDAINKGFARTSGEIMGWISATDQLQLGGLKVVGSVFRDLPSAEWITGRPTILNDLGMTVQMSWEPRWSRFRFLAGANRAIQQESTYWRRSLWERAGSRVDSSRRNGADFELWVRFFRHAQIYPVDALIGAFRNHPDSLGMQHLEECYRTHDQYIDAELDSVPFGRWLRLFRRISRRIESVPKVNVAWKKLVIDGLYNWPGLDWPPMIEYQWAADRWTFRCGRAARLWQAALIKSLPLRKRLGLRRARSAAC
jgi:glycosyltransferase involved in cell wall biosynthesis